MQCRMLCTGWLEPLLDEIKKDKTVVTVPSMDVIKHDTFQFDHVPPANILAGGFDWNLNFLWMYVSKRENLRRGNDSVSIICSINFIL